MLRTLSHWSALKRKCRRRLSGSVTAVCGDQGLTGKLHRSILCVNGPGDMLELRILLPLIKGGSCVSSDRAL